MAVQKNTKLQLEVQREQDERAEREAGFPLFTVVITGDEVEWLPRNDPRYFKLKDPDDPRSGWVSIDGKPVMQTARATVDVRAVNKNMAEVAALTANPGYHSVESCEKVKE